ncbi:NAD(P)-dependent dehydrogenase, short-chain alcohol dehydrogenase family [Sphingobium sp. AP50]|uniref:SDR family NAD(P)-dependent oxidoreductase n=1 Tax=Sphingobium sp. AP50 TaxID=1884369 RepID=UPI0008CAE63F|nr:SDR family oxidoreductase [Sphingobium sp. AP50]SEJ95428.1 NAD(P)-dependent dehydrogenase, short-chain alcohol dehydrogenase family [Sphingobium sp. AP50]
MELEGKRVVITGAAGDIGGATARRCVEEGASVMLLDIDENAIAAAAAEHASLLHYRLDVTSSADVAAAAAAVQERMGMIDLLFLNAGIEQPHAPFIDLDEALFDRVMAVNVKGVFLMAKHFVPIMRDGGSIVITASIASLMGLPGNAAYSASKAAVAGMMRSIATDCAVRGIRCNTVHPGSVNSRMMARSAEAATGGGDTTLFYEQVSAMAKLGRMVEPVEIAEMVVFLGSDRARMVTGQSLVVDGGTVA